MHAGLFVQMVGRVLRPWPGKLDALVLDVTGAAARHNLNAHVDLFGEDDELGVKAERELDPDEEVLGGEILDEYGLDLYGDEAQEYARGELRAADVDLFHGSHSAWLRTHGGTWFLPAGRERLIAIVPALTGVGLDVVAMHRYQVGQSRPVASGVAELAYAMAWAEQDITAEERHIARKDSSWRARRPSATQRDLAARYGIAIGDRELSGEVSNKITIEMASQRIDPRLDMWMRARGIVR
jgi:superfamily II DNA or RNA helicase